MTTDIDLSGLNIDVAGWVQEQAAAERALLNLAQEEREPYDDLDYAAATELLFKFTDQDPFYAPDVLAAIELGTRMLARKVLGEGHLNNISPLTYFGKDGGPRGNRKTVINLSRLQLRKELGLHLTMNDAEAALTMERGEGRGRGKKAPRAEWPEVVGEVEIFLVEYVLARFLNKSRAGSEVGEIGGDDVSRVHRPDRLKVASGSELELAQNYVRDSFAWIPWHKPDEPVRYPADW